MSIGEIHYCPGCTHAGYPHLEGCSAKQQLQNNLSPTFYQANSGFGYCPVCGQPATTSGFLCGYGSLIGCTTGSQNQPLCISSAPYHPQKVYPETCVMCEVFQQQIIRERDMRQNLYELLEYEKLKADAYKMVWSAREYLRQNWGTDFVEAYDPAWRILTNVLNTFNAERVDGVAIREKYNPKVIKLKKRTEYGYGGSPDCGVVFDRDDWHKHWGPKC